MMYKKQICSLKQMNTLLHQGYESLHYFTDNKILRLFFTSVFAHAWWCKGIFIHTQFIHIFIVALHTANTISMKYEPEVCDKNDQENFDSGMPMTHEILLFTVLETCNEFYF